MDRAARQQRIGVAHENSKAVDDAVSAVVASAYTPPATCYADNGDTLTHYGRSWQEQTSCLDALREIAEAVYGRFYVARDGTPTFGVGTISRWWGWRCGADRSWLLGAG